MRVTKAEAEVIVRMHRRMFPGPRNASNMTVATVRALAANDAAWLRGMCRARAALFLDRKDRETIQRWLR